MQMKREMQNGCPNQASLKWPISQRQERMHGGKEEEKEREKTTLSEKKGGKTCQRATGQRLDTRNPWTRSNSLSSDNMAGQQTLMNYPTQKKNEWAR